MTQYINTSNKITITSGRIVNPLYYNYTQEEQDANIEETINRIIERVRERESARSTAVVTEEYMELPLADDEDETSRESEATVSEATVSESEATVSESEATVSEATVSESEATVSETTERESEASERLSEEELQAQCQEITGKPLAELPVSIGECSICLDTIDHLVNISSTRCGHTFHTHCFLRAIQNGSGNCPNCRSLLVVKSEDDDSDDEYDMMSDYDSDDDTITEEDVVVSLEQATTKLQNLGYSVADILSLYVGPSLKSSQNPEKYTPEFIQKMNDDLDGILEGTIALSQRDTRSYAAALGSNLP
jgi:hypothetical protein